MTQSLWTMHEVQKALGLPRTGENVDIQNVQMDSRLVEAGDMFVALAGTPPPPFVSEFESARDGHAFVANAFENGAVAALVEQAQGRHLGQIVVPNTFQALWRLAEEARERSVAKRVVVTGSYGKTTTKEMLALLLGGHKAEGSFNNCWGVPLSLARLPADAPFTTLEIGMSHPGEIAPLTRLARPDVALITLVGPAHLEGLGTVDNVAKEKFSIQEGLAGEGVLVAPAAAVSQWPQLVRRPVLTFSAELPETDASLLSLTEKTGRLQVRAKVLTEEVRFTFPTSGRHLLGNALGALLVALHLGQDPAEAGKKLSTFQLLEGRGATHVVREITLIDDSGNGQPLAMQAALRALAQGSSGRRFALIGDMLELGETELEQHMALQPLCEKLDGVWAVGERIKPMYDALPTVLQCGWFPTAENLPYTAMKKTLAAGDTVLIKASKKILNMHGVVENLEKTLG